MKTRKIITLILFSLSVTLCMAQANNKATVYIVRTSGLGAAINFKYFIGDQYVGKINHGKYFKLELEPGEYVIWAKAENKDYLKATLESGQSYVIDAKPQMGAFKASVRLEAVNNPTEKELNKINKCIAKNKLIQYDEKKRELEQLDYADIIEKGLRIYKEEVEGSPDLEILNTPIILN